MMKMEEGNTMNLCRLAVRKYGSYSRTVGKTSDITEEFKCFGRLVKIDTNGTKVTYNCLSFRL